MAATLQLVVLHMHVSDKDFREIHFGNGIKYLIIVPLVLQGLPLKARQPPINQYSPIINLTLGAILSAKMGTAFIASTESGGVMMAILFHPSRRNY